MTFYARRGEVRVPDVCAALAARAEGPEEVAAEEPAFAAGFLRSVFAAAGFLRYVFTVTGHGGGLRRRRRAIS
jgi:hypothetical protein